MSPESDAQRWVLLGTSPASRTVWGLDKIDFPCGYMMPPGAFTVKDTPLERPCGDDVWMMGGYAFEMSGGGKKIPVDDASQLIAGYRPWVCVFHHSLLDELTHRGHTIEMWDRGISIFHGLWRQSCQALGELIPVDEYSELIEVKTSIEFSGKVSIGDSPGVYSQKAPEIIHFMSQFLTVSPGDTWIKGPLVAARLPMGIDRISYNFGAAKFEMRVA